jgi:hypothetical protein
MDLTLLINVGLCFSCSFPLVALLGGVAYGAHLDARFRRSRQQLPPVRVASAPEGALVKLVGRVRLVGQPMRSPAGGRECVFFDTAIEEERARETPQGHRDEGWCEIGRETKAIDFLLEDETGCAFVRAAAWLVVPSIRTVAVDASPRDGARPELTAFLERRRLLRPGATVAPQRLRFREGVLAPGDRIELVGRTRWELDPTPTSYRARLKRLIVVVPPDGPLIASPAAEPA